MTIISNLGRVPKERSDNWAYSIAKDVMRRGREHVVATGITPSGHIHIGNIREILIADAVHKAMLDMGADSRLIHIADTYDPLRSSETLPKEYENYMGFPISNVPDPEECCPNYAEHFLLPFLDALDELGVETDVFRADEMYACGMYDDATKIALEKREEIARIIDGVSGRRSPRDWSPFNPICSRCGRITLTKVTGFDLSRSTVDYVCECGHVGETSMRNGKLTWRVDWPARWKILSVTVEPFGKDHAAAGSSFDSGKIIAERIYEHKHPYPIPFEHILLRGRKMSSSKGILVDVNGILKVIPPDALRYIICRTKPEKHIEFDPGMGLLNLIDEYERNLDRFTEGESEIPFRHMISVVQIANSLDHLLEILKRSGYDVSDTKTIGDRAARARRWLSKFAPDFIKFEIKEEMPEEAEFLSEGQKEALLRLSSRLGKTAGDLHDGIYDLASEVRIKPEKIFEAIYISLLGKKSGPRAGFFLASLDEDFVKHRFEEVAIS
jgi:lysyl-tRNA synthetase class 1